MSERKMNLGRARTVEQPQPDKFDTHENETRWLELSVAYDDGASIFGTSNKRGYYAHASIVVEERRPGSNFVGRRFFLLRGNGAKMNLAPAKRYSEQQLEKQAHAFLRDVDALNKLVDTALATTGFSLAPGALSRALTAGAEGA